MFARKFSRSALIASVVMSAVEAQGVAGGTESSAPKLTPAERRAKQIEVLTNRIATDTTKLAELKLEAETSERLASVQAGSAITARVGRAETSKEVAAVVLGVKVDDTTGAVRYKITFGEGFDQDTAIIQPSQIIAVRGEEPAVEAVAAPALTTEQIAAAALAAPLTDEYGRVIDAAGNVIG